MKSKVYTVRVTTGQDVISEDVTSTIRQANSFIAGYRNSDSFLRAFIFDGMGGYRSFRLVNHRWHKVTKSF